MTQSHADYRVARELLEFFNRNPSEELSPEDVAVKYDISLNYARSILAALVGNGELQRVSVYRLTTPRDPRMTAANQAPRACAHLQEKP